MGKEDRDASYQLLTAEVLNGMGYVYLFPPREPKVWPPAPANEGPKRHWLPLKSPEGSSVSVVFTLIGNEFQFGDFLAMKFTAQMIYHYL